MIAEAKLYTWIDVQDVLVESLRRVQPWPTWLFGFRAYWDSLTVFIGVGQRESALNWLRDVFDPRFEAEGVARAAPAAYINLESLTGFPRALPIVIEESAAGLGGQQPTPTLSRPGMIQSRIFETLSPIPLPVDSPRIYAFHSFKGGVGRTMHAMALANLAAKRGRRALLVDADFEAPGITWMLETRLPAPPLSFADLLALAHGDTSEDLTNTVSLAAKQLRSALVDGVYVVPAFRPAQSLAALEIRPEHLVGGHADPFILTKLLSDLGRALGADIIVVDLRAGFSELSAGLLLDPRIQRILVSTLSGQAIHGTLAVLELLAERAPSQRDDDPAPNVILNQVPPDQLPTGSFRKVEESLYASLLRTIRTPENTDGVRDAAALLKGPTYFDPALMIGPKSWDDVIAALNRSRALETVEDYIGDLVAATSDVGVGEPAIGARQKLQEAARQLVFAESSGTGDFLATSPLRKLAADHRSQVPIAIVVGAKGAGKTYTFLQLVRRQNWAEFLQDANAGQGSIAAAVAPVLGSLNLREAAAQSVGDAKKRVATQLGETDVAPDADIRDRIRKSLNSNLHEGQWREEWLNIFALAAGFKLETNGGRAFVESLRQRGHPLVCVVDGLEDLFQNLPSDTREQTSLRSLLQEVPAWLAQQPERPLGLVVFVRRDMVLNAVKQNAGQLMARYEPYALRWDRVEALRLVLWVCREARCMEQPDTATPIAEMAESKLIEFLLPLWGRKLGPDRSREARSAEWVIAALSDFRGQIQARDLVRFLYLAAKHSMANPEGRTDRILVPSGIRLAVADCSREKISEILQENPPLGVVLNHLRSLPPEKRSVPFDRDAAGLNPEQISLLEANGVIVADEGQYYMPEIFRRGLDFNLPQGARPKVLALARRRS